MQYKPSTRVYLAAGIALLGALSMGYSLGFPDPASLTLVKPENGTCSDKRNQSDDNSRTTTTPTVTSNTRNAMLISTAIVPNSTKHVNDTKSDNGAGFQISQNENSLNGGIMPLAALFGAMAGGPVSDWIGRKLTLIIIGVPFSLGWLLIGLAAIPKIHVLSLSMLLIGRFITGFFTGCICSVVPTYLVEISTPQIRGSLGTFFQILVTVGYFVTSLFGIFATPTFHNFFKWQYIAYIGILPSSALTIGMIFMPESHVWILNKSGKGAVAAETTLTTLRTASSDKKKELAELQKTANKQDKRFRWADFKTAPVWKPFVLSVGLGFFQQFSGINAVMFYLVIIFETAGLGQHKAYASAGVKFVQVLATLAASFLIDRLGRKKLLVGSAIGHTVSLLLFVLYFALMYKRECVSTASTFNKIFAVLCLTIYIISFSIGWGPIPWLMVAEITPGYARGVVVSIATVFNWTFAFTVGVSYPLAEKHLGPWPTFAFFAFLCFLSIFFTTCFLPETKGKTFDEIQAFFVGKAAPSTAEGKTSKEMFVISKSKDDVPTIKSKEGVPKSKSKDDVPKSKSKDDVPIAKSKSVITASKSKDTAP